VRRQVACISSDCTARTVTAARAGAPSTLGKDPGIKPKRPESRWPRLFGAGSPGRREPLPHPPPSPRGLRLSSKRKPAHGSGRTEGGFGNPSGEPGTPKHQAARCAADLMARQPVTDWLLEEGQPAVRYRALTELLGRGPTDPEVRDARTRMLERGWVADILSERTPRAGWADGASQYVPKYISTHWKMLVLADLGVTKAVPDIRDACEYWMTGFAANGGGLGGNSRGTPHYCVAANMARALIRFGYEDDPRVRRTLEWLVTEANPLGGWSCFRRGRNLDSWEALSAFAAYPRAKWTSSMKGCVERGAEYFLHRELHRQGEHYDPWYRFHYPVHYYYDLLVGLDFLTELGYGADPRLGHALTLLLKKRDPDGRWKLDALHPDVEGPVARWFQAHPLQRPTPWGLEVPGKPSKMITLNALRILSRVEG
jgi:hypothetical protein